MTTTGIFSGLEDGGLFNSLKAKAAAAEAPKEELSGIFDKAKEEKPRQLVSTPRRVLVQSGKRDMILSGSE